MLTPLSNLRSTYTFSATWHSFYFYPQTQHVHQPFQNLLKYEGNNCDKCNQRTLHTAEKLGS
jgi:hypothetical protein